ncbi:MAG: hypothetical protein WBN36_12965 [Gammaproteobacteria bacterium]
MHTMKPNTKVISGAHGAPCGCRPYGDKENGGTFMCRTETLNKSEFP